MITPDGRAACDDCGQIYTPAPGVFGYPDAMHCGRCVAPSAQLALPDPPDGHRWAIRGGGTRNSLILTLEVGHAIVTPTERKEVGRRQILVIPGRPATRWEDRESVEFDYSTDGDVIEHATGLLADHARHQRVRDLRGVYHRKTS